MNQFFIINPITYLTFLKPLISIFIIFNFPNYDESILILILVMEIPITQILHYP